MAGMLFFYKLAPSLHTKPSALKLSKGISNKLGQRHAFKFMQAFALELRAHNQHHTNLDIKSEISLIERFE